MELQGTPLATQPFFDPRRGEPSFAAAPVDVADIILYLHPSSETAIETVRRTAQISPQHIRQTSALGQFVEDDLELEPIPLEPLAHGDREATESTQLQDTPIPRPQRDSELALRFSSHVKDPSLGFTFGRNEKDCDIVFKQNKAKFKVSNMHFRIFVNDDGLAMIQDSSTNGTFLDDQILRSGQKHVLGHGSKIEVVTYTESKNNYQERASFIVSFPWRDGPTAIRYNENFNNYKAKRETPNGVKPTNGTRVTRNTVGIGNSRFNQGMHWDGAPKYSVVDQIGKGAFATVYRLATRSEGKIFAAKEIQKGKISNRNLDEKIENEIDCMKRVSHPHVIQLYESHDIGSHLYIILEYMPEGDLMRHFGLYGCLKEDMAQSITKQLCHALSYCHALKVTHRDIKPDNVLIFSFDPLWVKLSDFGLSKVIDDSGGAAMRTFCGTMLYCAPEVYPDYASLTRKDPRPVKDEPGGPRYKSNVDIWSLGAVFFHLIAGDPPFEGRSGFNGAEMLRVVLNNTPDFTVLRNAISEAGVTFIQRCLEVDSDKRPDALACLQFDWLQAVPDVVSDLPPHPPKQTAIEVATTNALGISGLSNGVVQSSESWIGDSEAAAAFLDYRQSSPISDGDGVEAPAQRNSNDGRPKLFGEVGPTGADSGIFGNAEKPVIVTNGEGEKTEVATPEEANGTEESMVIQSTVSHVQDLKIDSPSHLSMQVMPPPPSASFLKRQRDEDSADSLAKTSKRMVIKSKSNGVTKSRTGPMFGKLLPTAGSISEATELILRGPVSAWGRHPVTSHTWPDASDRRIPKTGLDLVFWSASAAQFCADARVDWVNVDLARDAGTIPSHVLDDLEPYLKTRGSLVLRVGGVPLSRVDAGNAWQVIRLRTDDVVEIFRHDDRREHLQFKCQFFVGKGRARRRFGEPPAVEAAPELQAWSEEMNARRSTEHQVLT